MRDNDSSILFANRAATAPTSTFDATGAVMIIPFDAAIPSTLGEAQVAKGSFYERLRPLADPETIAKFAIVPLSGPEFIALETVWRILVQCKKVVVLTELPAVRYDPTFEMGQRVLGIKSLAWPSVSEQLESEAREVQRSRDTGTGAVLLESPAVAPTRPQVRRHQEWAKDTTPTDVAKFGADDGAFVNS